MPASHSKLTFQATIRQPAQPGEDYTLFLKIPQPISEQLPSRGLNSIEGTFNHTPFQTTLHPDGKGGHWMKITQTLADQANLNPGDEANLEFQLCEVEPEPQIPADFQQALDAHPESHPAWNNTTPIARRDWIHWITSPKKAETRTKRIATAMDMMAHGKKRPCCFDSSGMFSNSLSCPSEK